MTMKDKIQDALDSIRPFLHEDGGDVELIEVTDDGKVRVSWVGACKSCSMNTVTFKTGIEEAVMKAVPEVVCIEVV